MVTAALLRLVTDATTPYPRVLELRHELLVKPVAKVLNRRARVVQDDWRAVVGHLSLGLGVDAQHFRILPNAL